MPYRRVRKKRSKNFFERFDSDERYLFMVKLVVWVFVGIGSILAIMMVGMAF